MTAKEIIAHALRTLDMEIIPKPGDADWPAWNARLQAGLNAINQGRSARDSGVGISIRFIRNFDPTQDVLFMPGERVKRPSPEPLISAEGAAYLDDWFAK